MNTEVRNSLAIALTILAVSLAAKYAQSQGAIDQDTVLRLVIGMNGLMIAYFGNRIPKVVAPSDCVRKVTRVAGWSLVLSGLVYAGLWALAPLPVAKVVGTAVVLAGIAVSIGYGLWLRGKARRHHAA